MTYVQWLILLAFVAAVGVGYWLLRSRGSTDPWRNMDHGDGRTPPTDPQSRAGENEGDGSEEREDLGLGGDSYIVAVRTLTSEPPAHARSTEEPAPEASAEASWQAYKQSYGARAEPTNSPTPSRERGQPTPFTLEPSDDESATRHPQPDPTPREPEIPPERGPTLDPLPESGSPESDRAESDRAESDIGGSREAEIGSTPAPELDSAREPGPEPPPEQPPKAPPTESERAPEKDTIEPQPRLTDEQEIFVIHAFAGRDQQYAGRDVHAALADQGLRFGFKDLYHRVSRDGDRLVSIYGVANMLNPGTLDPAEADTLSTPGLTLFMVAPATEPAPATLRDMMETANALTIVLGGQVLDERRAVLKAQTAQHMLDRAAELDRRATLAKRR